MNSKLSALFKYRFDKVRAGKKGQESSDEATLPVSPASSPSTSDEQFAGASTFQSGPRTKFPVGSASTSKHENTRDSKGTKGRAKTQGGGDKRAERCVTSKTSNRSSASKTSEDQNDSLGKAGKGKTNVQNGSVKKVKRSSKCKSSDSDKGKTNIKEETDVETPELVDRMADMELTIISDEESVDETEQCKSDEEITITSDSSDSESSVIIQAPDHLRTSVLVGNSPTKASKLRITAGKTSNEVSSGKNHDIKKAKNMERPKIQTNAADDRDKSFNKQHSHKGRSKERKPKECMPSEKPVVKSVSCDIMITDASDRYSPIHGETNAAVDRDKPLGKQQSHKGRSKERKAKESLKCDKPVVRSESYHVSDRHAPAQSVTNTAVDRDKSLGKQHSRKGISKERKAKECLQSDKSMIRSESCDILSSDVSDRLVSTQSETNTAVDRDKLLGKQHSHKGKSKERKAKECLQSDKSVVRSESCDSRITNVSDRHAHIHGETNTAVDKDKSLGKQQSHNIKGRNKQGKAKESLQSDKLVSRSESCDMITDVSARHASIQGTSDTAVDRDKPLAKQQNHKERSKERKSKESLKCDKQVIRSESYDVSSRHAPIQGTSDTADRDRPLAKQHSHKGKSKERKTKESLKCVKPMVRSESCDVITDVSARHASIQGTPVSADRDKLGKQQSHKGKIKERKAKESLQSDKPMVRSESCNILSTDVSAGHASIQGTSDTAVDRDKLGKQQSHKGRGKEKKAKDSLKRDKSVVRNESYDESDRHAPARSVTNTTLDREKLGKQHSHKGKKQATESQGQFKSDKPVVKSDKPVVKGESCDSRITDVLDRPAPLQSTTTNVSGTKQKENTALEQKKRCRSRSKDKKIKGKSPETVSEADGLQSCAFDGELSLQNIGCDSNTSRLISLDKNTEKSKDLKKVGKTRGKSLDRHSSIDKNTEKSKDLKNVGKKRGKSLDREHGRRIRSRERKIVSKADDLANSKIVLNEMVESVRLTRSKSRERNVSRRADNIEQPPCRIELNLHQSASAHDGNGSGSIEGNISKRSRSKERLPKGNMADIGEKEPKGGSREKRTRAKSVDHPVRTRTDASTERDTSRTRSMKGSSPKVELVEDCPSKIRIVLKDSSVNGKTGHTVGGHRDPEQALDGDEIQADQLRADSESEWSDAESVGKPRRSGSRGRRLRAESESEWSDAEGLGKPRRSRSRGRRRSKTQVSVQDERQAEKVESESEWSDTEGVNKSKRSSSRSRKCKAQVSVQDKRQAESSTYDRPKVESESEWSDTEDMNKSKRSRSRSRKSKAQVSVQDKRQAKSSTYDRPKVEPESEWSDTEGVNKSKRSRSRSRKYKAQLTPRHQQVNESDSTLEYESDQNTIDESTSQSRSLDNEARPTQEDYPAVDYPAVDDCDNCSRDKPIQCSICRQRFPDERGLELHVYSHFKFFSDYVAFLPIIRSAMANDAKSKCEHCECKRNTHGLKGILKNGVRQKKVHFGGNSTKHYEKPTEISRKNPTPSRCSSSVVSQYENMPCSSQVTPGEKMQALLKLCKKKELKICIERLSLEHYKNTIPIDSTRENVETSSTTKSLAVHQSACNTTQAIDSVQEDDSTEQIVTGKDTETSDVDGAKDQGTGGMPADSIGPQSLETVTFETKPRKRKRTRSSKLPIKKQKLEEIVRTEVQTIGSESSVDERPITLPPAKDNQCTENNSESSREISARIVKESASGVDVTVCSKGPHNSHMKCSAKTQERTGSKKDKHKKKSVDGSSNISAKNGFNCNSTSKRSKGLPVLRKLLESEPVWKLSTHVAEGATDTSEQNSVGELDRVSTASAGSSGTNSNQQNSVDKADYVQTVREESPDTSAEVDVDLTLNKNVMITETVDTYATQIEGADKVIHSKVDKRKNSDRKSEPRKKCSYGSGKVFTKKGLNLTLDKPKRSRGRPKKSLPEKDIDPSAISSMLSKNVVNGATDSNTSEQNSVDEPGYVPTASAESSGTNSSEQSGVGDPDCVQITSALSPDTNAFEKNSAGKPDCVPTAKTESPYSNTSKENRVGEPYCVQTDSEESPDTSAEVDMDLTLNRNVVITENVDTTCATQIEGADKIIHSKVDKRITSNRTSELREKWSHGCGDVSAKKGLNLTLKKQKKSRGHSRKSLLERDIVTSVSEQNSVDESNCVETDSTENSAQDASTEILAQDASTEILAQDASTEILAQDASTEILAQDASTEILAQDASTEILAQDASTEILAQDASTEILAQDASTEDSFESIGREATNCKIVKNSIKKTFSETLNLENQIEREKSKKKTRKLMKLEKVHGQPMKSNEKFDIDDVKIDVRMKNTNEGNEKTIDGETGTVQEKDSFGIDSNYSGDCQDNENIKERKSIEFTNYEPDLKTKQQDIQADNVGSFTIGDILKDKAMLGFDIEVNSDISCLSLANIFTGKHAQVLKQVDNDDVNAEIFKTIDLVSDVKPEVDQCNALTCSDISLDQKPNRESVTTPEGDTHVVPMYLNDNIRNDVVDGFVEGEAALDNGDGANEIVILYSPEDKTLQTPCGLPVVPVTTAPKLLQCQSCNRRYKTLEGLQKHWVDTRHRNNTMAPVTDHVGMGKTYSTPSRESYLKGYGANKRENVAVSKGCGATKQEDGAVSKIDLFAVDAEPDIRTNHSEITSEDESMKSELTEEHLNLKIISPLPVNRVPKLIVQKVPMSNFSDNGVKATLCGSPVSPYWRIKRKTEPAGISGECVEDRQSAVDGKHISDRTVESARKQDECVKDSPSSEVGKHVSDRTVEPARIHGESIVDSPSPVIGAHVSSGKLEPSERSRNSKKRKIEKSSKDEKCPKKPKVSKVSELTDFEKALLHDERRKENTKQKTKKKKQVKRPLSPDDLSESAKTFVKKERVKSPIKQPEYFKFSKTAQKIYHNDQRKRMAATVDDGLPDFSDPVLLSKEALQPALSVKDPIDNSMNTFVALPLKVIDTPGNAVIGDPAPAKVGKLSPLKFTMPTFANNREPKSPCERNVSLDWNDSGSQLLSTPGSIFSPHPSNEDINANCLQKIQITIKQDTFSDHDTLSHTSAMSLDRIRKLDSVTSDMSPCAVDGGSIDTHSSNVLEERSDDREDLATQFIPKSPTSKPPVVPTTKVFISSPTVSQNRTVSLESFSSPSDILTPRGKNDFHSIGNPNVASSSVSQKTSTPVLGDHTAVSRRIGNLSQLSAFSSPVRRPRIKRLPVPDDYSEKESNLLTDINQFGTLGSISCSISDSMELNPTLTESQLNWFNDEDPLPNTTQTPASTVKNWFNNETNTEDPLSNTTTATSTDNNWFNNETSAEDPLPNTTTAASTDNNWFNNETSAEDPLPNTTTAASTDNNWFNNETNAEDPFPNTTTATSTDDVSQDDHASVHTLVDMSAESEGSDDTAVEDGLTTFSMLEDVLSLEKDLESEEMMEVEDGEIISADEEDGEGCDDKADDIHDDENTTTVEDGYDSCNKNKANDIDDEENMSAVEDDYESDKNESDDIDDGENRSTVEDDYERNDNKSDDINDGENGESSDRTQGDLEDGRTDGCIANKSCHLDFVTDDDILDIFASDEECSFLDEDSQSGEVLSSRPTSCSSVRDVDSPRCELPLDAGCRVGDSGGTTEDSRVGRDDLTPVQMEICTDSQSESGDAVNTDEEIVNANIPKIQELYLSGKLDLALELLHSHPCLVKSVSRKDVLSLFEKCSTQDKMDHCHKLFWLMRDRKLSIPSWMMEDLIKIYNRSLEQNGEKMARVFFVAQELNIRLKADTVLILLRTFAGMNALNRVCQVLQHSLGKDYSNIGNILQNADKELLKSLHSIVVRHHFTELAAAILRLVPPAPSASIPAQNMGTRAAIPPRPYTPPPTPLMDIVTPASPAPERFRCSTPSFLESWDDDDDDEERIEERDDKQDTESWIQYIQSVPLTGNWDYLAELYVDRCCHVGYVEVCYLRHFVNAMVKDTSAVSEAWQKFMMGIVCSNKRKEDDGVSQRLDRTGLSHIGNELFHVCCHHKLLSQAVHVLHIMDNYSVMLLHSPFPLHQGMPLLAVRTCIDENKALFALKILKAVMVNQMPVPMLQELIGYLPKLIRQLDVVEGLVNCFEVLEVAFSIIFSESQPLQISERIFSTPNICSALVLKCLQTQNFPTAKRIYALHVQYHVPFVIDQSLQRALLCAFSEKSCLTERQELFSYLRMRHQLYPACSFSLPRVINLCWFYADTEMEIVVKDYIKGLYNRLCDQTLENVNLTERDLELIISIDTRPVIPPGQEMGVPYLPGRMPLEAVMARVIGVLQTTVVPPLSCLPIDHHTVSVVPQSLEAHLQYLDKRGRWQGLNFKPPSGLSSRLGYGGSRGRGGPNGRWSRGKPFSHS